VNPALQNIAVFRAKHCIVAGAGAAPSAMARQKVAPENRIRAAQACENCKRRKQKVRPSVIVILALLMTEFSVMAPVPAETAPKGTSSVSSCSLSLRRVQRRRQQQKRRRQSINKIARNGTCPRRIGAQSHPEARRTGAVPPTIAIIIVCLSSRWIALRAWAPAYCRKTLTLTSLHFRRTSPPEILSPR
jgi:hypothetical protein